MTPEAINHLKKRCKVMRRLIREHGPCELVPKGARSPFESLVRAVAHQQLNGTAAESILRRFRALFPKLRRFPKADELAAISDEAMRACGFSGAKIAALRDIAEKTLSGLVPASRSIQKMSDDEIVERLTQVRGVGRWTVEMMLIFKLGRPDVLPADDFGVRNGFRIAFGLDEMPRPRDLLEHGERWRPYATTAAWYLWRAADAARQQKPRAGVNA
ncbi:MAG: DNA-3-methyladenine glycosylase family protein [Verrucomicrobiales bacterium]